VRLDLSERAPIYAWLAPLFVREIDATTWQELQSDPLRSILTRLEPSLDAELELELLSERASELDEEFTRLFLLPGGVLPVATAWLETSGEGQESEKPPEEAIREGIVQLVGHGFEALGREPVRAEPWGRLPLDHISLLFDLVSCGATSSTPSDLETAHYLDRELLGEWLERFGRALSEQANEPIYRALGRLLYSMHDTSESGLSHRSSEF
jgi:TorA maturation chaperone TorD